MNNYAKQRGKHNGLKNTSNKTCWRQTKMHGKMKRAFYQAHLFLKTQYGLRIWIWSPKNQNHYHIFSYLIIYYHIFVQKQLMFVLDYSNNLQCPSLLFNLPGYFTQFEKGSHELGSNPLTIPRMHNQKKLPTKSCWLIKQYQYMSKIPLTIPKF